MTVRAAPLLKPLKSSGAWGPVPSLVQGQSPWHYRFTTAPAYGRGSAGAAAAPQPAMACARNHAGRVGLGESGDGHRPGASVGCGAAHPTHELCNEMSAGRQPVGGPRRNVTKNGDLGGTRWLGRAALCLHDRRRLSTYSFKPRDNNTQFRECSNYIRI